MSETRIEISRTIAASAQSIYQAWLDPSGIAKWFMPGEGVTVPNPKIDPSVGGKFDLTMKVGENLLPHQGEYKKLDPYQEIQFTWISPGTGGNETLVTIRLEEAGTAETKLTLIHEMLPNEESRNNHHGGWTHILEKLSQEIVK